MTGKRKTYDWERIETEYRANRLSNREISKAYGVPESTLRSRAKKHGWTRDVSAKARKRTEEKISRSVSRTSNAREDEIIEEIADRSVQVVESHRKDINDGRQIAGLLMGELRDGTEHRETIAEIIDQQADDEGWDARRRSMVNRAISLPQRAGVMRDLATAMKTLQQLERTAFGIDGREGDRDPLDEILEAVSDTSRGIDGYGQ